MKKLVSMYQKYMFRPILYKSVTRVSVVAVLMLLWDRYVSDGTFIPQQVSSAHSRGSHHGYYLHQGRRSVSGMPV